jgi:hypothetical protein
LENADFLFHYFANVCSDACKSHRSGHGDENEESLVVRRASIIPRYLFLLSHGRLSDEVSRLWAACVFTKILPQAHQSASVSNVWLYHPNEHSHDPVSLVPLYLLRDLGEAEKVDLTRDFLNPA